MSIILPQRRRAFRTSLIPEILWAKLNEGTGTFTADSTGNGNSGTLIGGSSWTTGPNSTNAVTFDGIDGYIEIANEANFDLERTDSFSITGWVKVNASATGNGRIIFGKLQQTGNSPGIVLMNDSDNQLLRGYLVQLDGNFILVQGSINSFTPNIWRSVVFTYDGSSAATGMNIYVNGLLYATGISGTLSQSILNDNPVYFGRGTNTYFWGDLDDMRVYRRILSLSEINTLYSGGAQ